jgi:MGT family glycosyltransferase
VANVYFFNGPDHGHVNPTLGLVAELVNRGDCVTYFTGDAFRTAIQRTGAHFRAYHAGPPPPETISGAEHYAAFLLDYSALLLPALIEQAKVDKPDYIIFDMHRLWGWHLARLLNVPSICSSPSFALTGPVLGAVVPDVLRALVSDAPAPAVQPFVERYTRTAAALRGRYGVDSPSILQAISMTGDITLVFTTPRIHPATHLLDPTIYLVGPSFHTRSEANDDFPLQLLEDQPVVFISLGTIFNARGGLLSQLFAGVCRYGLPRRHGSWSQTGHRLAWPDPVQLHRSQCGSTTGGARAHRRVCNARRDGQRP